jgi:hypothetical protein
MIRDVECSYFGGRVGSGPSGREPRVIRSP